MNAKELTRQQLDPAGSVGVRTITAALAAGALGYSVVMTWVGWHEISDPLLAIAAVLVLAGACWLLVFAASPYRAPLTRNTHYLVLAFALVAVGCEEAGHWGVNQYEGNDWGAVCLGVMFVALGPYRPARELASTGVLAAILIGFVSLLQVRQLTTPGPPLAFVIVAVAPLLVLCFAAATFSFAIVNSIRRWQLKARTATLSLVEELRGGVARSVQQENVTIIEQDVLPFFAQLLSTGRISAADQERARTIADSIRCLMVADADRSWLETAIDRAIGPTKLAAGDVVVDDQERVAAAMTTGQRTALRALLVAMVELPRFGRDDLRIALWSVGGACAGQLTAQFAELDYSVRSALTPFLAVLRAEFSELVVGFSPSSLTIRFSYEQQ